MDKKWSPPREEAMKAERWGHGRRRNVFLLSKQFRSPRWNFSCHLPTYQPFLTRLIGLYSGNGFEMVSQKREWENTHNCSLYYTPTGSAALVPLVLPFPTSSWAPSVRSSHLGNKAIWNCPGLWTVRAGYKELLKLEAAKENRPVQSRGVVIRRKVTV